MQNAGRDTAYSCSRIAIGTALFGFGSVSGESRLIQAGKLTEKGDLCWKLC